MRFQKTNYQYIYLKKTSNKTHRQKQILNQLEQTDHRLFIFTL